MADWTRGEKIGIYSFLVAVIGVLIGLLTVPEFRTVLGLSGGSTKTAPNQTSPFNSGKSSGPVAGASPNGEVVRSYRTVYRTQYVIRASDEWKTAMPVRRGTWVSVSASGSVTWDPLLPAVGPDGGFPAASLQNPSDFPVPSAGCGALIMRIGDTKHVVGSAIDIQAQSDGEIQFMVNDRLQSLSDNTGSFTVLLHPH